MAKRLFSALSTRTSVSGPKRQTVRHSSEPMLPPAPVMRTVWPCTIWAITPLSSCTAGRRSISSKATSRSRAPCRVFLIRTGISGRIRSETSHGRPRRAQRRKAVLGRSASSVARSRARLAAVANGEVMPITVPLSPFLRRVETLVTNLCQEGEAQAAHHSQEGRRWEDQPRIGTNLFAHAGWRNRARVVPADVLDEIDVLQLLDNA